MKTLGIVLIVAILLVGGGLWYYARHAGSYRE